MKREISTYTMQENLKSMEHEGDCYKNYNCCPRNNHQMFDKGYRRLRNQRTSRDYSIVKIGQNTEKSLEEFRWLAIIQVSCEKASANARVKNSQKSKITIIREDLVLATKGKP